jgi:hypothetical protein
MKTAVTVVLAGCVVFAQQRLELRPFTVDDEMAMRSLVDVAIAPDGSRVAYVVSTPVLVRNEHEGALFVVPTSGGMPVRLAEKLLEYIRGSMKEAGWTDG